MTLTEDKTVQIGIVGSLAVHVVVFLFLVWSWGVEAATHWIAQQQREAQQERQVTLLYPDEILEVPIPPPEAPPPPPPPPKKLDAKPYIRTTQNETSAAAPERADFISDRNTVAASKKEAAPDGDSAMPTTDGVDFQTRELANRNVREGETKEDSATAMPPVPLMRPPEPIAPPPEPATPPPTAVAKAEPVSPLEAMIDELEKEMVKVDASEPPKAKPENERDQPDKTKDQPPDAKPPQPTPNIAKAVPVDADTLKPLPNPDEKAFQPFTRTSKVKGTISNRGEDSVNAMETPMGKYMRIVTSAVEKRWHYLRREKADAVTFGNLKLRFYVTKSGKAEDLKILSNPADADPRMTDFTLQAILEAKIPPIPDELVPVLERERLEVEYDVLIY